MNWPKNLNKKIKSSVSLKPLTSFKIGGRAKFYFEPGNLKELQSALGFTKKKKIPVYLLGAGSNILVSDKGINGLVISLNKIYFNSISLQGNCIRAGGGLKLNKLLQFAKARKLSGFEFLAGIPGSVGGSLIGNAGAWGKSIGQLAKKVYVLDYCGREKILSADKLRFNYRNSNLNKYIITGVDFKLKKADEGLILSRIRDYLLKRNKTQKTAFPNAGCIFKNPVGDSAGRLIDACGLKGKNKGGAVVSKSHANFILNTGKAKCSDVLSLMSLIKDKVKKEFKINLEPEIKIWK